MPLKIALLTGEFPPMEGGVGAFSRELGRALAAQGHEIHIITGALARPRPERPAVPTLRDAWRAIDEAHEPFPLEFGLLHPRGRRWTWRETGMVADLTERYAFDVVNIQYQAAAFNMRSPAVNLLPWRLRGLTTTVVTFHDLRVPYLFPKAGRLRPWLVRQTARQAQGAIATNPADFDRLAAETRTPLRQIPIGSNIAVHPADPTKIEAARAGLGLGQEAVLLGYFGFLNESKGADLLVEALAGLDSTVHLVFIGGRLGSSDSANNQAFLEDLTRQIQAGGLAGRVHWTGFLEDPEVSTYFHLCDLVVLPYRDGVSLRRGTLMAGLAHGRPILSTVPEAAVPELRHGENIWLVTAGEIEGLVGGIERLLRDRPLRQRLGAAAQETSRLFTWETIAAQTAAFFEELTSPRGPSAG